jgi:tRNA A-37 threonylcarbamoyl transferase component Bud32
VTLPDAIAEGTRIGPYTVRRTIGRGATALVVLARGAQGDEVAVKVRRRGVPAADRRFLREFESMRTLRLPGVVRVFEAGIDARHVWFSMEYVRGIDVVAHTRVATGRERVARALDVGVQLLDVLAALHAAGLAHRDIKPSNVLVDDRGKVQVLDFGIGRFFDRGSRTDGEEASGTLPYMAPEQLAGLGGDHAVDLFATGLMLHEALAGARPAPANPLGWVTRTCLERLEPLAMRLPEVPRRLSRLVEDLLHVDPRRRPSAQAAAGTLRRVGAEPDSHDWPEPPFVDPGPWWERLEGRLGDPGERFVQVLDGPAGSGRRRAVEQLQRHALLQGVRTLHVTCDATRVGGPIREALEAVLGDGGDETRVRRIVGGGSGALRQMWPHLPLPAGPSEEPVPTMTRVAEAAAELLARAAAESDLLLVIHALEQVDALSARALHRLAIRADEALGMVLLHDPRWATPLSERVIGGLEARHGAGHLRVPPLDARAADAVRRAVSPEAPVAGGGPTSPQRAVEEGYAALAAFRGEPWGAPGAHLWPLAVHEPLPVDVLTELVGDGIRTSPWVRAHGGSLALAGDTARRAARSRLADLPRAARTLAETWSRLDPDAPAADLARLYLLGGRPEDARPHVVRAALAALVGGRYAVSRQWLFLVDTLPEDPAAATDFPLAAAKARVALVTEAEQPRDLLVEACEAAARTEPHRAEADLLRATYRLRQGAVRPALVAALRIASPGRAPTRRLAVDALVLATRCRLRLGHLDDARAQLTRAEALLAGAPQDPLPRHLEDEVALLRAELLLRTEELDAAGAQAEALLLHAHRRDHLHDHARAAHLLARVLRLVGRRRRAESLARTAVTDAVETGDLGLEAMASLTLATLLVERGDAGAARRLLDDAIRRLRSLRQEDLLPRALRVALQVAVAHNDAHTADVALATFRDDPTADPEAPAVLVRWWRGRGDLEAALSVPGPTPGSWAHLLWQAERARVHLVAGDPSLAAREAARARSRAADQGFDEVELYARLLQQAALHVHTDTWDPTVREAAAGTWTELCFGALELDARRRAADGDHAGATSRWQALRARCEELGYHPGWEEAAGWLDASP